MYVYLLRSESSPAQKYIGLTHNLKKRVKEHNEGVCKLTSKFMPWKIETFTWFRNPQKGLEFENT